MDNEKIFQILGQLQTPQATEAWAEFLEQFSPLILQVIRLLERNADSVADCYVYVCEQLCRNRFRRLCRFQAGGPASFRTWLCVVVRNLSLDWRRRKYGRERAFESITRLPSLDQELLSALHQQGLSDDEAMSSLRSRHPDLSSQQLEESRDRLLASLTPRQLGLLGSPRISASGAAAEPLGLEEVSADQIPDNQPDPESQVVASELHAILRRARARLANPDRLLIHLRFEQGLTLEQVAKIVGLPDAQTADRRIRTILVRLRKEIG